MARSEKVQVFGIHECTVLDYFTMKPVAALDVVGDLTIPVSAESESLFGGSHTWPVAGEPTTISAEGSLELREFPADIAEYLACGVSAKVAASASGTVIAPENYKGTSIVSATTGIATITAKTGETGELKAGLYVVEATAAAKVDVYALTTVDLKKGTDIKPLTDGLLIASDITVSTGTATEITDLGVEITGGSGTIGMAVGDTAFFEIYPPHAGAETMTLGQKGATFKRVGLLLVAQKQTTGEIGYIFCPSALALGIPFGMPEKGFAGGSVDLKIFTHPTLDFSMKFTHIRGISV